MRLKLVSDLHLEFCYLQRISADKVFSRIIQNADVLVIAGDLAYSSMHELVLEKFSNMFKHVVLVAGNHDYYTTGNHDYRGADNKGSVDENLSRICEKLKNVHFLNNSIVEIEGQRFLGSTLWFKNDPFNAVYTSQLNDFTQIKDFCFWVYSENKKAISFFERNVRKGDIIVSHHLPGYACISPQFRSSELNRFYVCDMTRLIDVSEPALWLHGHTHNSLDFEICKTRVICNPHGYEGYGRNREFDGEKIIVL